MNPKITAIYESDDLSRQNLSLNNGSKPKVKTIADLIEKSVDFDSENNPLIQNVPGLKTQKHILSSSEDKSRSKNAKTPTNKNHNKATLLAGPTKIGKANLAKTDKEKKMKPKPQESLEISGKPKRRSSTTKSQQPQTTTDQVNLKNLTKLYTEENITTDMTYDIIDATNLTQKYFFPHKSQKRAAKDILDHKHGRLRGPRP
jgi:hypothetical protein